MKRVLCLRFPNWPIQRLQRQLRQSDTVGGSSSGAPLAVYTPLPSAGEASDSRSTRAGGAERDLKYVRSVLPSARSGTTVMAVSAEAWSLGIRPGMPLAEARSMARPLTREQPTRGRPEHRSHLRHAGTESRGVTRSVPLPEVGFHEWDPQRDRDELQAAAERTRPFAPITGLDEMVLPDSLLLDITGCAPLFGGESALADQLLRDLHQDGIRCRIAIADTVAAAWAFVHADGHSSCLPLPPATTMTATVATTGLSRDSGEIRRAGSAAARAADALGRHVPVLIVPPGQQRDHLGPLPLAAGRLLPDDIRVLSQLGLRSLDQLLGLPREDLPARLSPDAVRRVQQLSGHLTEMIAPIPESIPVSAEWFSEFPAETMDALRQVLQLLVGKIGNQLQQRRLGCVRLSCELAGDTQLPELTASVVRATQSTDLLLQVLGLRLEAVPFHEPVRRVRMLAVTAPLPVVRQRDLFGFSDHISAHEELAALVNRLSSRLGSSAVTTIRMAADPRPEHALEYRPVMSTGDVTAPESLTDDVLNRLVTPDLCAERDAAGGGGYRPLRLLPVPFLLSLDDGGTLLREGFVWQGQRFRIHSVIGPERLQTAWWTDQPVQRDYYRVATLTGSLVWIFRELTSGHWYLHGVFE